MGKGFAIAHTKVSICIGLNGKIHGFTELTITPTSSELKTLWLNARSLHVVSVALRPATASADPAETLPPLSFVHVPPTVPRLASTDIHAYPALKRALWVSTNEGEEGELGIGLPAGSVVKVERERPDKPSDKDKGEKDKDEWEPMTVVIKYEVSSPGDGICVVGPDEANPNRFPQVFTVASDLAARSWLPCSDALWDRCTWDLEFIVPRILYSSSPDDAPPLLDEDQHAEDVTEWPISVVASGELIEQVAHPTRSDRVIWHYMLATPTSVQQIAWAVGPFVVTEIVGVKDRGGDEEDLDDDEEVVDNGPKLFGLCLPGREEEMKHSVGVVRQAMEWYGNSFGSYPFTTYTVAFLDSLAAGAPTFHSAALTLLSADLLHPKSIVDQAYETRHLLAHALATQWSGVNLIPRLPSDTWLTTGIALHLTSLFLRHLWGNNEYRFRLKKDMIRCVAQDVAREPISVPARATPHEPEQLQFIALKAPLVLHILDKYLRKSGTSLGLDKVLPKLFLDAITGDLGAGITLNTVSTSSFMRTCRKTCGGSLDVLKTFFDQWVYGSGCPTFVIEVNFNRKKMAIELNIQQECLAANWAKKAAWEESSQTRAVELFEGQMSIRIHEADGTPYEHVLTIGEKFKRHEVPFNTKYKRVRRNTKRYQARQAAASAAALGDTDALEEMNLIDVGFALTLWEDEGEREKWRVADWTEEDDSVMSQATYEWIRVDAELEWICGVSFEQPDFMWLSQLQRDRDVVAQLDAVHALSRMPSAIISGNLAKTVLVNSYFFRVRMEAALALISCATKAQDYLGLFHLLKLFQMRYCFEPESEIKDPFGFRCIPKTNDFEDLEEYFLKKTLITAISMVRDELGQTPPVVQQFLLDMLSYNDNLANKTSDTYYITTMISAMSHALVAVAPVERSEFMSERREGDVELPLAVREANDEVERHMSADRLVPSYRNAITVAGLEFKLKLTLSNLIPMDLGLFFSYTREGNYPAVRVAAFDALLLLGTLDASVSNILDHRPLVSYYFSVIQHDQSLLVRRRLAQSMLECMPILVAIGDFAPTKPKGLTILEEGETKKSKSKTDMDDVVLKPLRNAIGRQNKYREGLLAALRTELDVEVLHCLLKICENTIKPKGEAMPKLPARLPVPSSPSLAAPSSFPKLKLSLASRALTELDNASDPGLRAPYDAGTSPIKIKLRDPAKPPRGLKSQAKGMSIQDVKACQSVLKKLFNSKISLLFRSPVDPVKSGAPGYFDIVQSPMDLSTMQFKLSDGHYANRDEFRRDLKLVVANAELYNVAGIVVEQAWELDAIFEKQWARVLKTLEGLDRKNVEGNAVRAAYAPPPAVYEDYAPIGRVMPVEEERFLAPPPRGESMAPPAAAGTPTIKLRLSISQPHVSPTPPLVLPPPPAPPPSQPYEHYSPYEHYPLVEPLPPAPIVAHSVPPPMVVESPLAPAVPPPPTPTSASTSGFKLKFRMHAPSPVSPAPVAASLPPSGASTPQRVPHTHEPSPAVEPFVAPMRAPSPPPSAVPSYVNLNPPPPASLPAPVAAPLPPAAPPVRPSFKIKFNTSSRDTHAPVPPAPEPAPIVTPAKVRSFEEDIDDMFPPTAPSTTKIKIKSAAPYIAAPVPASTKKAKVISYADSPSPPMVPEYAEYEPLPVAGPPAALNEPRGADPEHWFPREGEIVLKKAKAVMKKMVDLPESFFFRLPVEAVGGLADYYREILSPMDLQTLSARLNRGDLRTYGELFDEFDLIIRNCKQFNPPNTEPVWHVEVLDRAWRKEWEKASKMTPREKIALGSVLKNLMKEGAAWPFIHPLDPIAAGVPHYYDIIPRENARDLSTIHRNLLQDKYTSIEAVQDDVELMIENCLIFNDPSSPVYVSGTETQLLFDTALAKLKADMAAGGVKRANKDKDKEDGNAKKPKYV